MLENGLRRVGHSSLFDTTVKSGAPACSINCRCALCRDFDAAVANRAAGTLCRPANPLVYVLLVSVIGIFKPR
jgi:hypothetical protein